MYTNNKNNIYFIGVEEHFIQRGSNVNTARHLRSNSLSDSMTKRFMKAKIIDLDLDVYSLALVSGLGSILVVLSKWGKQIVVLFIFGSDPCKK